MWAIVASSWSGEKKGSGTSGALVEEGKFSVDIVEQQPERPKDGTQNAGEKIVSG